VGLLDRLRKGDAEATLEHSDVERVLKFEVFDDDRHQAFGFAYVARAVDVSKGAVDLVRVVDHSGEFVEPSDLEKAAYEFNLEYREGDEGHTETVTAHLIESMVFTEEKLAKFATSDGVLDEEKLDVLKTVFGESWWTGWQIDDAMWPKVRKGELPMLSIGGHVDERVSVDA
jgi:hypothetical protein